MQYFTGQMTRETDLTWNVHSVAWKIDMVGLIA